MHLLWICSQQFFFSISMLKGEHWTDSVYDLFINSYRHCCSCQRKGLINCLTIEFHEKKNYVLFYFQLHLALNAVLVVFTWFLCYLCFTSIFNFCIFSIFNEFNFFLLFNFTVKTVKKHENYFHFINLVKMIFFTGKVLDASCRWTSARCETEENQFSSYTYRICIDTVWDIDGRHQIEVRI